MVRPSGAIDRCGFAKRPLSVLIRSGLKMEIPAEAVSACANCSDRSRDRRLGSRADASTRWLRRSGVRTGLRVARGWRRHPDKPQRVANPPSTRTEGADAAHGSAAARDRHPPMGRRARARSTAAGRRMRVTSGRLTITSIERNCSTSFQRLYHRACCFWTIAASD